MKRRANLGPPLSHHHGRVLRFGPGEREASHPPHGVGFLRETCQ